MMVLFRSVFGFSLVLFVLLRRPGYLCGGPGCGGFFRRVAVFLYFFLVRFLVPFFSWGLSWWSSWWSSWGGSWSLRRFWPSGGAVGRSCRLAVLWAVPAALAVLWAVPAAVLFLCCFRLGLVLPLVGGFFYFDCFGFLSLVFFVFLRSESPPAPLVSFQIFLDFFLISHRAPSRIRLPIGMSSLTHKNKCSISHTPKRKTAREVRRECSRTKGAAWDGAERRCWGASTLVGA